MNKIHLDLSLDLDIDGLKSLCDALALLPYFRVAPLLEEIQRQAQPQILAIRGAEQPQEKLSEGEAT